MAVSEFNRFVLLSNVDPYTPVLWLTRFFTWLEPIANAIPLPVCNWLLNSWALGQTEPIVELSLMATRFFSLPLKMAKMENYLAAAPFTAPPSVI